MEEQLEALQGLGLSSPSAICGTSKIEEDPLSIALVRTVPIPQHVLGEVNAVGFGSNDSPIARRVLASAAEADAMDYHIMDVRAKQNV